MDFDVVVLGGGAAGLMAAIEAGKRSRKVLLIEHTTKVGEKIRISGGGRCNFTNLNASPKNYISNNPHFPISALSRYTQYDFIKLVESYDIAYHEKTLGQLFCDRSSKQIIDMLLAECHKYSVKILLECSVDHICKVDHFRLSSNLGEIICQSLIVATGGLSIPKIGATDFGYKVAKQFSLNIINTRPALVPLLVEQFKSLSGISIMSEVKYRKNSFRENILFTHRGLSGPAILQISSYLENFTNDIILDLLPDINILDLFTKSKQTNVTLKGVLKNYLPNRFVDYWCVTNNNLAEYKMRDLENYANALHHFQVTICGNEGYEKAEVTRGGVDTAELSSKTMMAKKVPGLFFIGEVVDVTGWLGGYNFQWAWSSGYVAGQYA
jgi:predicted Rossmann fold flavoprotein